MNCWKCNKDIKFGKKCQTCFNYTCSDCNDFYCLCYQKCDICMNKEITIASKIRWLQYLQNSQTNRKVFINIYDEKGNSK